MCLTTEQRLLFENLNVEEASATPEAMKLTRVSYETRQGYMLPSEVRGHHAHLAFEATRSPEGKAAFEAHRQAHHDEAARLKAERQK